MIKLIFQAIAATAGLWLAVRFVPGVEFVGEIKYLILAGVVLGVINFFLKPIINFITLPLRVITFGLFSLVINMALIWIIDIVFPELIIQGLIPLFWTTLIIWVVSIFLGFYPTKRRVVVK